MDWESFETRVGKDLERRQGIHRSVPTRVSAWLGFQLGSPPSPDSTPLEEGGRRKLRDLQNTRPWL